MFVDVFEERKITMRDTKSEERRLRIQLICSGLYVLACCWYFRLLF